MRFISLFSGIGGFDLAFQRAGMECVAQVEIDKNCRNILERHYPNVRRYEDIRECGKHNLPTTDLICGGFPCQDLSVAGKRKGLAGERSGLWFEFARIIDELEPRWVVIENVPGLLSSDGGQDFAVVIQWLAKRGYGVAWRVFDAQYFGLAQRRKRVFVVGSFGNGRAAEVLFEREGMCRDNQKKREAGKIAPTLFANGAGTSRTASAGSESKFCIPEIVGPLCANAATEKKHGDGGISSIQQYLAGHAIPVYSMTLANTNRNGPYHNKDIAQTLDGFGQAVSFALNAKGGSGRIDAESETFIPDIARPLANSNTTDHFDESQQTYIAFMAGQGSKAGSVAASETLSPTLKGAESGTNQVPSIAWQQNTRDEVRYINGDGQITGALSSQPGMKQQNYICVRRLTPTECERLMGFQDGYTDGQADSVRYRQLGNAVAVPVVEWIGKRIMQERTK